MWDETVKYQRSGLTEFLSLPSFMTVRRDLLNAVFKYSVEYKYSVFWVGENKFEHK